MSSQSIQDRIRRLQQNGDGDDALPVSGAVAAAKARLARSTLDIDSGKPRTVSNIASKFTSEEEAEKIPSVRPPSVPALRERVTGASSQKNSTHSVTARAQALSDNSNSDGSNPSQVSARLGALNSRANDNGGVAARAGKFEKAASEDRQKVSGLVSMRSNQLDEKKAPSAPSTPLKSRAALFESDKHKKKEEEPTSSANAPSRVAAATAAFNRKPNDEAEQPKVGRVASAAKDRELHEVRTELSDMVAVSQELLSELAQLRKGMREMEATRDGLLKRIEKLEKKAK